MGISNEPRLIIDELECLESELKMALESSDPICFTTSVIELTNIIEEVSANTSYSETDRLNNLRRLVSTCLRQDRNLIGSLRARANYFKCENELAPEFEKIEINLLRSNIEH